MFQWPINFNLYVRFERDIARLTRAVHDAAEAINSATLPPETRERLYTANIAGAVRGTTGIEGIIVSDDEAREIVAAPAGQPVLPDHRARVEREARAAHSAFQRVEQILSQDIDRPLTEDLIRAFHDTITRDLDYDGNTPGQYRRHLVRVGTYSPPDPDELPQLMERLIEWLHVGLGAQLEPIARAVVAHFLLVSIHPFGDGNGRSSRAVESYLLYQAGINVRGFYSLSNYYYRERDAYFDALNHVRFRSDPDATPFVRFALVGLQQELERIRRDIANEAHRHPASPSSNV